MALSDASIDKIQDAASEAQRFRQYLVMTRAQAQDQLGAPIPAEAWTIIRQAWQTRMDQAAGIVEEEVRNPTPAPVGK